MKAIARNLRYAEDTLARIKHHPIDQPEVPLYQRRNPSKHLKLLLNENTAIRRSIELSQIIKRQRPLPPEVE